MSEHPGLLTKLVDVMREQCWGLEQLSCLLQVQHRTLEHGGRHELEENTEALQHLNRLLLDIEQRREALLDLLALDTGRPRAELRLKTLGLEYGEAALLGLGARLGRLLEQITEQRGSTRRLLQKKQEHADRTLGWLRGFRRRSGTYDREARLSAQEEGGLLLDRTA